MIKHNIIQLIREVLDYMRTRKAKIMVGDFETTVYKDQIRTDVWASACVELYTEDFHIFHSIDETFEYFLSLNENIICYYHNLKFDGNFWLSYLINVLEYEQAIDEGDKIDDKRFVKKIRDMKNKTFTYAISDLGLWYRIIIKVNNHTIELRDSLKLLPFSVEEIGKAFETKHKKLSMKYEGFRYPGCNITDEEKEYIKNDVLVVKEALEFMLKEGHTKLTIGSCCLAEYTKIIGFRRFQQLFPNLYELKLDQNIYGSQTIGDWIYKSYRGGWCYVVEEKAGKIFKNGCTLDVNSLYPSMMSSESLNSYPVGIPTFWSGNYIPEEAKKHGKFYFVRIKTRFYLKKGYLPFIQIKNNLQYKSTLNLRTSDIYDRRDGKYHTCYIDLDGNLQPATVTLTLTMMDFELIKKHYKLVDFEILDGCYFDCMIGIFDKYINKYKKIKMESKGAKRSLSKLYLNNLYGKMSSTKRSNFKIAYRKEDGTIGFYEIFANDKKPGYIPVGSAITSYSRCFTIKAAQQNYYGSDKKGFIYADTDSIHCDLPIEKIKGVRLDDKNFCCWKAECFWDKAIFVRQKTYIEHVVDPKETEESYYSIKCAGMPDKCKKLFIESMTQEYTKEDIEAYTDEEKEFVKQKRSFEDFNIGLRVPGKLLPKRIPGGILLTETTYEMR